MVNGLMQLSDNFFLVEFLRSDIATRYNISEQFNPPKEVINNLKRVANFLQGFRNYLNSKRKDSGIIILSGYRCKRVNDLAKGSVNSFHILGLGVDFYSNKFQTGELFNELRNYIKINNLDFDQLIWEFGDSKNPAWVHLGINILGKSGRKQVFAIGVNKRF